MKESRPDFQIIVQHFLFWMHALFLAVAVFLGLFVTPLAALLLIAVHRLHVILFGECALSKIQRRVGGLPPGVNFLQHLALEIFGREISYRSSQILDYSLAGTMLAVALVK